MATFGMIATDYLKVVSRPKPYSPSQNYWVYIGLITCYILMIDRVNLRKI